jgi:hypothetical protein
VEEKHLPFDYWIYIGTVHLNRREEEIWRMTPRKLLALWEQHCVFKGWKKSEKPKRRAYIDDVL